MSHSKYFNAEGTVKLAPKQGEPPKYKDVAKKSEDIQICLNCTKPRCSGFCKKIGAKHKQHSTEGG